MSVLPVPQPGGIPPYGAIIKALRSGKAIPFLGAGASLIGRQNGDATYLPSGSDLARALAKDSQFPSTNEADLTDLSKVSSYYVDVSSRDLLRQELRSVFADRRYVCNGLHRFLVSIADNMMVVTTNYDTLLERAFIDAGKPYDLVVYPADNEDYANAIFWWRHGSNDPELLKPQDIDIEDLGKTNVIYKMHGSVRQEVDKWDSFVITEEDYIDFLSRMESAVPSAFSAYFGTRSFLFLGYGLKDWNLRLLLRKIRRKTDDHPRKSQPTSWAMQLDPSALDRQLWEKRGVNIYNVRLEDFVVEMQKSQS
jgi:SIR2-like domain